MKKILFLTLIFLILFLPTALSIDKGRIEIVPNNDCTIDLIYHINDISILKTNPHLLDQIFIPKGSFIENNRLVEKTIKEEGRYYNDPSTLLINSYSLICYNGNEKIYTNNAVNFISTPDASARELFSFAIRPISIDSEFNCDGSADLVMKGLVSDSEKKFCKDFLYPFWDYNYISGFSPQQEMNELVFNRNDLNLQIYLLNDSKKGTLENVSILNLGKIDQSSGYKFYLIKIENKKFSEERNLFWFLLFLLTIIILLLIKFYSPIFLGLALGSGFLSAFLPEKDYLFSSFNLFNVMYALYLVLIVVIVIKKTKSLKDKEHSKEHEK